MKIAFLQNEKSSLHGIRGGPQLRETKAALNAAIVLIEGERQNQITSLIATGAMSPHRAPADYSHSSFITA